MGIILSRNVLMRHVEVEREALFENFMQISEIYLRWDLLDACDDTKKFFLLRTCLII